MRAYLFESHFFIKVYRSLVVASDLKIYYFKGVFTGEFDYLGYKATADSLVPIFFNNRHTKLAAVAHSTGETVKTCISDDSVPVLCNEKDSVGRAFKA